MSGGCPLFRITRALASRCDKDKLAASSYQETTKAVLAGASGTFWRNMLLDLAWIAARSGQSFDACCALLAEVIVACADECAGIKSALASCSATNARGEAPHVCSEPAAKRARTEDKELACATQARYGNPYQFCVPSKRYQEQTVPSKRYQKHTFPIKIESSYQLLRSGPRATDTTRKLL